MRHPQYVHTSADRDRLELGRSGYKTMAQPHPFAWSVQRLVDACERKAIDYEERPGYENLLGVVITVAGSHLISIKATQADPDKIFAIAHELAHVALKHPLEGGFIHYLRKSDDGAISLYQDAALEQAAHVWAAHLLVRPEVYELALREALDDEEEAMRLTAERLNIPRGVVRLWRDHRDWRFPEEPIAWLQQPADREPGEVCS